MTEHAETDAEKTVRIGRAIGMDVRMAVTRPILAATNRMFQPWLDAADAETFLAAWCKHVSCEARVGFDCGEDGSWQWSAYVLSGGKIHQADNMAPAIYAAICAAEGG